jgi:DNA-binding IclR family transcriptional regulator
VYGWAAWSEKKSILTLRNPSDKPQTITLEIGQVLELPAGAAGRFVAHSPWKSDERSAPVTLAAGEQHAFSLAPFEVVNLELNHVP